ncbi:hypothetical protein HAX54_034947 [Datura stramonium]|uniref:Uncharacterized protein n=1 Tax=Datura stramonium TaxID=4076 RepID=A0ABS8VGZ0_DATST|nr:hypothetical protein [Datura stramonium]
MRLQGRIPIWGEMVDISTEPINRMLYGPYFTPLASVAEFEYRMKMRHDQHGWLAYVLMDGQPSWMTNTKEIIVESTLTFAANFWWEVVQFRLFPIGGDNTSAEDRVETNKTTNPTREATRTELVCHTTPIPTSTPPTSSAAATQSGVDSVEMSSAMPQFSKYAFTPANFSRVVKKADRQEQQMKLFAEQLDLFVDHAITATLEPYKNVHTYSDAMEAR